MARLQDGAPARHWPVRATRPGTASGPAWGTRRAAASPPTSAWRSSIGRRSSASLKTSDLDALAVGAPHRVARVLVESREQLLVAGRARRSASAQPGACRAGGRTSGISNGASAGSSAARRGSSFTAIAPCSRPATSRSQLDDGARASPRPPGGRSRAPGPWGTYQNERPRARGRACAATSRHDRAPRPPARTGAGARRRTRQPRPRPSRAGSRPTRVASTKACQCRASSRSTPRKNIRRPCPTGACGGAPRRTGRARASGSRPRRRRNAAPPAATRAASTTRSARRRPRATRERGLDHRSPPNMTTAATSRRPAGPRATERRMAAPSTDSIRRWRLHSSPMTSITALTPTGPARGPATPIGPTSQAMSGMLIATATIAQATGVRVSCIA